MKRRLPTLVVLALTALVAGATCVLPTAFFTQPTNAAGITMVSACSTVGVGTQGTIGVWDLVIEQDNPNSVPGKCSTAVNTWSASSVTGFAPTSPGTAQRSILGTGTSPITTGQMEGATVGAYINTADYGNNTNDGKLMITPQIIFKQPLLSPWAIYSSMTLSLNLYLKTASQGAGSNVHGASDMQWVDSTQGANCYPSFKNCLGISYSTNYFKIQGGANAPGCSFSVDGPSKSIIVSCNAFPGAKYMTLGGGSTTELNAPQSGSLPFSYTVTVAQFQQALNDACPALSGTVTGTKCVTSYGTFSLTPADWQPGKYHANFEIKLGSGNSQLGFSMDSLTIAFSL